MTIKVTYENDYQGALLVAESNFGGDVLHDTTTKMYQHAQVHLLKYQILDVTRVDSIDIDIEMIQELASLDSAAAEKNKGMKIAVVAKDNLLKYLGEAWEVFSDSPWLETKVCKTVEEARQWIETPPKEK